MQIRLEIVLVGLAISFALPTFAQEKGTAVDPQIVQQLHAIGKKSDEAFLKGDATSLAAFFTQDAVLVTDTGPVYGRQAIEKYYANMFQIFHYFTHDTTYDSTSPHLIGTDGNVVWENGEWSSAIAPRGEDCGPRPLRGYFASVEVREGDTWKVRMATYNLTPAPPATPPTTIAPGTAR
jgi:ketosteroid isomerase-like protein